MYLIFQKALMNALHSARDDAVKGQIINDSILKRLGSILWNKLGERRKNCIIQRLRQLARLKLQCKVGAITDLIKGSEFDRVVSGVKALAQVYTDDDEVTAFKAPSLALQLGNHLRRVANVLAGHAVRTDNTKLGEGKFLIFL